MLCKWTNLKVPRKFRPWKMRFNFVKFIKFLKSRQCRFLTSNFKEKEKESNTTCFQNIMKLILKYFFPLGCKSMSTSRYSFFCHLFSCLCSFKAQICWRYGLQFPSLVIDLWSHCWYACSIFGHTGRCYQDKTTGQFSYFLSSVIYQFGLWGHS